MGQISPHVRQWLMLRMLSARRYGVPVEELAIEFEVTERTIRRDLAILKSVGFPLVENLGERNKKAWKLDARDALALSFTFDEALALYVARQVLEPLSGTMLWESAQQAFEKIRVSLPERTLKYLGQMASAVQLTAPAGGRYADKRQLIDQLMQAIEDRRVAFMTYQSLKATEPTTYEIEPLGILLHKNGSLYLVAFSREHNERREFKVDRMSKVEVQPFPFTPPADFDMDSHFANSFGVYRENGPPLTVRILFDQSVARYIQETPRHASEQLHPQPNGDIIAEYQVSSLLEVQSWVQSFGSKAEALEPKELREGIQAELEAALKKYEHSKTKT